MVMDLKTCLKVMFPAHRKGNITEIIERLGALGFKPVTGDYDFEYTWTKHPEIEDIAALGNSIQKALKNTGIMFKLETISNKVML